MPTFNGDNIFGTQVSQTGPTATRRVQREQLPGVRGFRSYNLQGIGPDTFAFVLRGRLIASTPAGIINKITAAQNNLNRIATLVDNAGLIWRNCQLIAYLPQSPYKRCVIDGADWYTVEIVATLEQASR